MNIMKQFFTFDTKLIYLALGAAARGGHIQCVALLRNYIIERNHGLPMKSYKSESFGPSSVLMNVETNGMESAKLEAMFRTIAENAAKGGQCRVVSFLRNWTLRIDDRELKNRNDDLWEKAAGIAVGSKNVLVAAQMLTYMTFPSSKIAKACGESGSIQVIKLLCRKPLPMMMRITVPESIIFGAASKNRVRVIKMISKRFGTDLSCALSGAAKSDNCSLIKRIVGWGARSFGGALGIALRARNRNAENTIRMLAAREGVLILTPSLAHTELMDSNIFLNPFIYWSFDLETDYLFP